MSNSLQTLFSLNGKRAIVTGAASGIGAAIAKLYAEAGATLVLTDINETTLETVAESCRKHQNPVFVVKADVSDPQDVARMMQFGIEQMKGVDILVNNAGMLTQGLCENLTTSMWDKMLEVDLRSVFLCSQLVIESMRHQRWGRIINIASQLGIKGGVELTHYSAAKAGVIGFTKSLAQELAPYNVLVNAIAPGPIETPLVDGISSSWKVQKAQELPLRRFGKVNEVAPTALLLASDPGGNLFVGQTLGPNSGDVMP